RACSTDLGQCRRTLAGRRGRDECFDKLHVQRDVPLVFGVPLYAGDPPGRILALEGLDESIGCKRRRAKAGRELSNPLVMIAVDPYLAWAVNLLQPSSRLHDNRVTVCSPVGIAMRDSLGHVFWKVEEQPSAGDDIQLLHSQTDA